MLTLLARITMDEDGQLAISKISEENVMGRTCRWVRDQYIAWGKTQGGRGGRPWDKFHAKVVTSRLTWWLDRMGCLDRPIDCLKAPMVEAVVPQIPGKYGEPPASKTRKEYVAVIKSWINWAEERDYVGKNNLKVVRLPESANEKEYRALTVDEYQRILAVAPPNRRLFYETSVLTGMRRKELCKLERENVDVAGGVIRLRPEQTKNRKGAKLPVPMPLLVRLAEHCTEVNHLGVHPQDCVFSDIDEEQITKDFHKDRKVADVARQTPEGYASLTSLRDLRATLLQANGVGLAETQKLMRHSSPEVTARSYTNITTPQMRQTVENLSASLAPKHLVPAVGVEPTTVPLPSQFTIQVPSGNPFMVNSGKIEELSLLVAVWFILGPDVRKKIMELAGYSGGKRTETKA